MRQMSAACRARLTEPWEEFVPYVYDDKVPKRRDPATGRLAYPEWDGGAVRGTLTIATGHTDAAGAPKIVQGLRVTRDEGDAILSHDLAPCEAHVNALLKVPVTQHQADAMYDTYFNCPAAAIAAIKLINAGNIQAVPAKLLQYTYSKGEHMDGLTHRRTAEIAWFNTPDHVEAPAAPHPDIVFCPKGERNPPPKPATQSKAITAGGGVAAGGVITAIQSANEAAAPIEEAKQHVLDLGGDDLLSRFVDFAHSPAFGLIVAGIIVVLGGFLILDRWSKLRNDHV
jgi:lysozyme